MTQAEAQDRWNMLLRVSRAWRLEWNLELLLGRVAKGAVDCLGAERSAIFLVDTAGLSDRAVWPTVAEDARDLFLSHCRTLAQQVVGTGRPVYARASRNSCCVPLTGSWGVFGALYVDSREIEKSLLPQDQPAVELLGEQAGAALEHAILYHSATTDPVTGLSGHLHFLQEIELALGRAAHAQTPVALAVLDLDHFKAVDDACGASAGNECLRQVAAVLRSTLSAGDLPARFGSDAFEWLMPGADGAAALDVAGKIREKIAALEFPKGLRLTATIGVASFPDNASNGLTLFLQADDALRAGKEAGGNCAKLCSGKMSAPMSEYAAPQVLIPEALASLPQPSAEPAAAAAAAEADVPAAEQIDGHTVVRRLESSSTSEVLLVRQPELEREVALKRPLTPLLTPEQARAFEHAAKLTASLEHPGIVPVHTMGHDADGRRYFTMKPVSGTTLAQILEACRNGDTRALRTFGQNRLLEVLLRASEALAFAHQRGAAHLALNPARILVGDYGEVSITDWGRGANDGQASLPLDELAFLAPEQLPGSQHAAGPHSDVHALGAMLYEILADRSPYRRNSAGETLEALANGAVVPLRVFAQGAGLEPVLSEICMKSLSLDPQTRPSAQDFSERLGRYLRRDVEWVTERFGPEGRPLVLEEWSKLNREAGAVKAEGWKIEDGAWVSQLPGENILVWNVQVPGSFRFVVECWIEDTGELSLIGRVPEPGTKEFHIYGGYCFQFGAEYNSCTKLARNAHDVAATGCTPIERHRHYRLELEYQEGWVFCYLEGKRVFSYRELYPFAGTRIGFYAFGAGTHLKPLEIQRQQWGLQIPPNSVADNLYAQGSYAAALTRYQEVADRVPNRMEGFEARLKMGMCQARLHSAQSACETFHLLAGTPLEPFALAEEAGLELTTNKPRHRRRGVELFESLFNRFPDSQARIRILAFWRSRVFNTNAEALEDEARLLRLARDTSNPPTQSQVRCQQYLVSRLAMLGRWKEALDEQLEYQKRVLPSQQLPFVTGSTYLMAALANGRDDLLPESDWRADETSSYGSILPAIVRKSDPAKTLEQMLGWVSGQVHWEWYIIIQLYLLLGREKECAAWIEKYVAPRTSKDMWVFNPVAQVLSEARAEELFWQCISRAQGQVEQNPESVWTHYVQLHKARWAVEGGAFDRAARELEEMPDFIENFTSEHLVLRAMLYSLKVLRADDGQVESLIEQRLAGTELDLARMFLGKKDPQPDVLWPHAGWRPEWRLWLALWLEAKGRLSAARDVAQPAVDARFGAVHLQQPLNALLRRVGAESPQGGA